MKRNDMKEHFKLLKDTISETKKNIETIANDSTSEQGLLLTSCADTLKVILIFIHTILEVKVQACLAERNALLKFINKKGLLEEFYGKK